MDVTTVTNRPRVLIVEDELPLAAMMKDKLEAAGLDARTAENGLVGLKHAKDWKPDLILLDVVMPQMDGLTMLKKLRQEEYGKDVAVVLLTNLSGPGKVYEALSYGVEDFLVKANWSPEQVVRTVQEKLDLRT